MGSDQLEVLDPFINAGMKQTDELARLWVEAGDVGTFIAITVRTGESEIGQGGFASVLLGDDVVYLKPEL